MPSFPFLAHGGHTELPPCVFVFQETLRVYQ